MSNKALANAERVADEAIEALNSLLVRYGELINTIEETYPGHFADDRSEAARVDAEVKRLRNELEGHG